MLIRGATHRSAPFSGRTREQGLLTQLITDGLESTLALIRVAGPHGMGRRRLIEETARRLPLAEWIDLAPGGVEADFRTWAVGELQDLLESYPDAPVPSWALHALGRLAPGLIDRAPVPSPTPEPLPEDEEAEVMGAAVGAVALALTSHVPVVVYAGLHPSDDASPRARALKSLRRNWTTLKV